MRLVVISDTHGTLVLQYSREDTTMFKIDQTAPNRLDIEMSGKLDASAMRVAVELRHP